MADAIVKISWCIAPSGAVRIGANAAAGGIAGTCFTLESGITLSCAHNMDGLFTPNAGFDACRVFAVERTGRITELRDGCLQLFPDYDACVIDGYQSGTTYRISQRQAAQITLCHLRGYEANTGPFLCGLAPTGTAIDISHPNLCSVAQDLESLAPRQVVFEINAADIRVTNKPGYMMNATAIVGLSGGPMLDALDNAVVGLCFMGLPQDAHQKTQIGAIDIRQFPFI